ncbi:leucyl aminopeptidase family protein [Sandaracinobacter neustonicus]|uniref:Probable cytosol aminopeptidase n=1 Tax=Sandaracinobacter neustonicus TaxID=1715348 RepID=A0A501XKU4_9SPHN|nr:leucyl aminopeptidase family protein [Sandaracinobacter neustonicus]TPE61190.1 leucyl aminopeptidase family protein [Sandaracinobacter neustonicus]
MRIAPFAALLIATALTAPALAQDRPAGLIGSGVAPSTRENSPERPIRFAATVPVGAALIVPVTAPLDIAKSAPELPAATAEAIAAAAKAARFDAKPLSTLKLHNIGGHPAILLVGVESLTAPKEAALADAAGKASMALRSEPSDIAILSGGLPAGSAPYLAYGAALAGYRYDRLKSEPKLPPANPVTVVTSDAGAAAAYAADLAQVAGAIRFARDLIITPANELYPESFVAAVQKEVKGVPNVRVTVLNEAQMRELGMGALLGVGQGSARPSRLLAVEYRGAGNAAPIALVGKGITFDNGGNSIKPAAGMWSMKADMSGAAGAVAAAIAAAKRGAKANVIGIAALAENMPGGTAQRPGDVVRTLNGKTVEMINADAEGRLVMADANQWAIRQYKPAVLVNLSTLTGAIGAALGDEYSGLFARNEDLAARLTTAGALTGEDVWRMPLHPSYTADMASDIADIKNANEGGRAGAGTAAHFISFLTPEPTPWAHVDMAGVMTAATDLPTVPKGLRAYGVRLFDQLIRSYEK